MLLNEYLLQIVTSLGNSLQILLMFFLVFSLIIQLYLLLGLLLLFVFIKINILHDVLVLLLINILELPNFQHFLSSYMCFIYVLFFLLLTSSKVCHNLFLFMIFFELKNLLFLMLKVI